MYRRLLLLAVGVAVACLAVPRVGGGIDGGRAFSFTYPDRLCGFSGTTVGQVTLVFRDTGNGTFFANGIFFARLHGGQWKVNHALLRRADEQRRRP